MSAPRKIWANNPIENGFFVAHSLNGGPTAQVYHHDDVVRELVEALEKLCDSDVPRPVAKAFRNDGVSSKNDRCAHDVPMYEDCASCCEDFARTALAKIAQEGR